MSDVGRFDGGLGGGKIAMGSVVSQTFATLGRNLVPIGVVAFVVAVLTIVLSFGIGYVAALVFASSTALVVAPALGVLVALVVRTVATGGITHIAISDLNGSRADVGQAFATGIRLAFPLLGLGIVVGLGVGLASLLLVVPGLMLAMRWAVATPARVVEGPPMGSALTRSGELTAGNRWRIFGLFVALGLFSLLVTYLATKVGAAVGGEGGLIGGVTQIIAGTITTSVSATGIAVLYAELRRVREGATPSQLAAVFA